MSCLIQTPIQALVPAAGLSSRMGGFKPLLDLGGKPLIVRTVESLCRGGAGLVTVALGYRGEEVEAALREEFGGADRAEIPPRLRFVWNRDFRITDMLASIRAALAAMLEGTPPGARERAPWGFFLIPADMPAVKPETLRALAEFAAGQGWPQACFPVYGGKRGHPPLISSACIPDILEWRGNGGLRGFWDACGEGICECAVEDPGCLMDADTPEDYQRIKEYYKQL
jgi:CTP:molybdopterin cytidylyltransferase MocA